MARIVQKYGGTSVGDVDRIKNVAVMGVNMFGWTFATNKQTPPAIVPHVRLTAPSGAIWTWNEPSETDLVEGSATEFCLAHNVAARAEPPAVDTITPVPLPEIPFGEPGAVAMTPPPTPAELRILREEVDRDGRYLGAGG